MKFSRRRFLASGSALLATTAMSSGTAFSDVLDTSQKQDFARIFGITDNLSLQLQKLQDFRTAVQVQPRLFAHEPILEEIKPAGETAQKTDEQLQFITIEACHKLALDLTALDHHVGTSETVAKVDIYGEQLGPHRSSWALGLVHWAMFESMNVFRNEYVSYKPPGSDIEVRDTIIAATHLGTGDLKVETGTLSSSVFHAAMKMLLTLYPKKALFIASRGDEIRTKALRGDHGLAIGKIVGEATTDAILAIRGWKQGAGFTDGSEFPEPEAADFKTNDVRKWQIDPISNIATALGGMWARVNTFVIPESDAFRPGPPPEQGSERFIEAYKEVKNLGGWGLNVTADPATGRWATKTKRTGDMDPVPGPSGTVDYKNNETFKAIFWGYDGTAYLCAPPRLYNALAMTIARTKLNFSDPYQVARFLAIVNITLADAGISAWEAKYHYLFPRPITYLRTTDADSTSEGKGEATWTPLGAAITNAGPLGRNVTPPFPAYPSGHAVFGGAVCEVLRRFMIAASVTDPSFTFISDEYNGESYSPGSTKPRPKVEAHFRDLAEPEEENGQSRIWMGIHWEFDKREGVKQGNRIAAYVMDNLYRRRAS